MIKNTKLKNLSIVSFDGGITFKLWENGKLLKTNWNTRGAVLAYIASRKEKNDHS